MRMREYVVIRESNEESTVAIVKAKVKPEVDHTQDFVAAVKRAVTKWAKTKPGEHAMEDSSHDFNIGDLAGCERDPQLITALATEGIANMEIVVHCNCDNFRWAFDDLLVEE